MNKKYIVILLLILTVQTAFFVIVTGSKDDYKAMEKDANEFYEEYKAAPENFTVVDAEVKELFTSDKFMNSTKDVSYITVEFKLPDGTLTQTQVLEDFKKNEPGQIIQIAYRYGETKSKNSLRATQLYYVENGRSYDRVKMLQWGDISLAVIMTLILLKKARE